MSLTSETEHNSKQNIKLIITIKLSLSGINDMLLGSVPLNFTATIVTNRTPICVKLHILTFSNTNGSLKPDKNIHVCTKKNKVKLVLWSLT